MLWSDWKSVSLSLSRHMCTHESSHLRKELQFVAENVAQGHDKYQGSTQRVQVHLSS